MILQH